MRERLTRKKLCLAAMAGEQKALPARAAIFQQKPQQAAGTLIIKARKGFIKKKRQSFL